MENQEEMFQAAIIDEQIEELLLIQCSSQSAPMPGARIVAELQDIAQENASILENTWMRIANHFAATQNSSKEFVQIAPYQKDISMYKQKLPTERPLPKADTQNVPHPKPSHTSQFRKRLRRVIEMSLIAAVVLMTIFGWGFFSQAFHQLNQSSTGSHGSQPGKQDIPQNPATQLYSVFSGTSGKTISRLDPVSGQTLWHFTMKPENEATGSQGMVALGNPQMVNGILYFVGTDADGIVVYAVNATTGTLLWKSLAGHSQTNLVIENGFVYVAQSSPGDEVILAFNAQTGQTVWQKHYQGSTPNSLDDMYVVGATRSTLYVASSWPSLKRSQLYALDAQKGTFLWQQEVSRSEEITQGVIAGNTLYLAGVDASSTGKTSIYAYDLSSHSQSWSRPITGSVSTLKVEQQTLYATTFDKNQQGGDQPSSMYALRASNGSVLWQQHPNAVIRDVAVAGGEMYLTVVGISTGTVQLEALRGTDGHLDWQQPLSVGAGNPGTLAVLGSNLYIGGANNTIEVIARSNGKQLKALPLSGTSGTQIPGFMLFVV